MSRAEIVARKLAGVVEHTRPLNGDKYLVPADLIHGAIEVLSELKADTRDMAAEAREANLRG